MNESSMDLTDVIHHPAQQLNKTVTSPQIQHEALLQENYEIKRKINVLERINGDLENEVSFLSTTKLADKTKLSEVESELSSAKGKIKQLENELEEEKQQLQKIIKENKCKNVKLQPIVFSDQDELDNLTKEIIKLEALREEDCHEKKQMLEDKINSDHIISQLQEQLVAVQSELAELKVLFQHKVEDISTLNETLESLREDRLLLNTELQMVKAANSDQTRGNSLFAEVEENRQKAVGQRELMKMKYLNLKKLLGQKQAENNKIKLELFKIRREDNEDEKRIYQDHSTLIQTLKERIAELESETKVLKQNLEKHPIIVTEGDPENFQLVNAILEEERNKITSLQQELDRRGSNYVLQGHQLFDTQKENRRLKASNKQLLCDIDVMKLDKLKLGNEEGIEDGISPPATEIALEYNKQKIVRFKESMKQIKSQVDGETAENQEQPLAKLNKSETINYFSSY